MVNINYRDPRPIYEQVKDGMRILMVTGALRAGDKIPSVRELAAELAINPNTIQRAYRELEGEGYLCSVAGKGSFVTEFQAANTTRQEELFRRFDEAVEELGYLGVGEEELCRRIRERRVKK